MDLRMPPQHCDTIGNQYAQDRNRVLGAMSGLCGALVSVIHLVGCASTGLPSATEMAAVSAGEKAIVLLRVECTIENQQSYEPFRSSFVEDNVSFGVGSFETGGEPKRIAVQRFLSTESRRAGWTFLVLPPGTHYLAVYPPRRTDISSYESSLSHASPWRFDVPEGAKLIYAGTLRLTGESDWLLFGPRIMRSIQSDKTTVVDDRQAARDLLAEYCPALGEGQVILMQRHEGPVILRSPLPPPANRPR